jgi:hypothetical protein
MFAEISSISSRTINDIASRGTSGRRLGRRNRLNQDSFGTGPDTGGVCLGSRLRRYRP